MNNWKKSLIAGMSFSLTLLGHNTFAQTMTTHAHTQIVPSTKYQLAQTPTRVQLGTCVVKNDVEVKQQNKTTSAGSVQANQSIKVFKPDETSGPQWVEIKFDVDQFGYVLKSAVQNWNCDFEKSELGQN